MQDYAEPLWLAAYIGGMEWELSDRAHLIPKFLPLGGHPGVGTKRHWRCLPLLYAP